MARKPSLNIDVLVALGPERLARLVLDGAENSPPFRKLVNAALAAAKGPDAVAKLVDRRLAALERARSFIDWEKARTFEADLAATVKSIVDASIRTERSRTSMALRSRPSATGRPSCPSPKGISCPRG